MDRHRTCLRARSHALASLFQCSIVPFIKSHSLNIHKTAPDASARLKAMAVSSQSHIVCESASLSSCHANCILGSAKLARPDQAQNGNRGPSKRLGSLRAVAGATVLCLAPCLFGYGHVPKHTHSCVLHGGVETSVGPPGCQALQLCKGKHVLQQVSSLCYLYLFPCLPRVPSAKEALTFYTIKLEAEGRN